MKCLDFVRALIYKDEKVLLINECKYDKFRWNFPGGKVEPGETVYEAIYREIKEEIGIECSNASLFYSSNFTFPNQNNINWKGWYFEATTSNTNFHLEPGILDLRFFSIDEIYKLEHAIPLRVLDLISSK